ncbi:MAG: hypothetical protein IPI14_06665 [Polaromonas sp.]|nr:hypothetical protein [Polaromonas sp.]
MSSDASTSSQHLTKHPRFSSRTLGIIAAVVTILIWTSFIVIARASVKGNLLPLDIVFLRFIGAGVVLLPWGWWIVRSQRRAKKALVPPVVTPSWLGLSPYAFKMSALVGAVGGVGYAMLAYSGFSLRSTCQRFNARYSAIVYRTGGDVATSNTHDIRTCAWWVDFLEICW